MSVTGRAFETSAISFAYRSGGRLIDFLSYLESQLATLPDAGIEEIEIWALMRRGDQINGELSGEEIAKLASMRATFCWSVIAE